MKPKIELTQGKDVIQAINFLKRFRLYSLWILYQITQTRSNTTLHNAQELQLENKYLKCGLW